MCAWLTTSWGVLLRSSHSHRWWSSPIPQMCHSLLSPQKQSDDLEKQRHVNNAACVKHPRCYRCHNTNSAARRPHATATMALFEEWKGKLLLFWYSSTSSIWEPDCNCTRVVLGEIWLAHSQPDAWAQPHLRWGGLIGSSPEGAGDRSGSERGPSPGARWQM